MSMWCLVYQVVEVAEDVGAEQGRADGEDVEVELVVGKNTHVPVLYITTSESNIHQFISLEGLKVWKELMVCNGLHSFQDSVTFEI